MRETATYRLYFNRVGAAPEHAWCIQRRSRTCRWYGERRFAHVVIAGGLCQTVYEPDNQPPVPKGYITVFGVLTEDKATRTATIA